MKHTIQPIAPTKPESLKTDTKIVVATIIEECVNITASAFENIGEENHTLE